MATPADVLKMIKDKEVKFVDLRFTDTRGKEQHVTVPARQFTSDKFESGHAFDGSSIAGWKGIQASDMLLMPDPATANIDPFMDETTLAHHLRRGRAVRRQGLRARPALAWPSAPRLISSPPAWATPPISVPSPNSSSSTPSSGRSTCRAATARCSRAKPHGRPPTSSRAATWAIARPSRAAISRCRRSTSCRTSVPRCAWRWSRWASRSRCITTKWPTPASAKSAPSSRRWSSVPTGCRSSSTACTTPRTRTARRRRSCPSPSSATTVRACTCTSRSGRTARTCSPVTAMPACRNWRSTTSVASSSTRRRSTRSPIPAPTRTSAWSRASRRRSILPIPRAIVRPQSAFPMSRIQRDAASKSAFRTRLRTRTWPFPP